MSDRKSEAEIPTLISDPTELAEKEAANALEQFDWAIEETERWLAEGKPTLRVSMLLTLHRKALDGIDRHAGNFRPAAVTIRGSKHNPVSGDDVARYVEEMLDYVIENWDEQTAIHLSSYIMWRLNWIHPFADGNGLHVEDAILHGVVRSSWTNFARHEDDSGTNLGKQAALL
ncbi:Fic family protein [Pseudooceanicola batsensis]|uniref:Fic family protein n=1 Tax=Pseudooceanicola batsensis TaxID=314255 RepID=UPI000324A059|nr:Fic family protein [Pseudooceanicola batsensis]